MGTESGMYNLHSLQFSRQQYLEQELIQTWKQHLSWTGLWCSISWHISENSDCQESCWDPLRSVVFSSFCEHKTIFGIRNYSIVKYRQKCKLTCVCKTPMMEYVWNSFRTAFAEQKLEYSPDSETKYFKQASAFLFRFYHDNFRTKYPNREKKSWRS